MARGGVARGNVPVVITEADVRRLSEGAAFAHGDLLRKGGHVLSPTLIDGVLAGDIRGTWRRMDHVEVKAGTRLEATCTCHWQSKEHPLCRHAVALLLEAMHKPSAFKEQTGHEEKPAAGSPRREETPREELTRLLGTVAANQLRKIARQRGLKLTARTKAELLEQLAPALAAPENIDAAVAELRPEESLLLLALDLIDTRLRTTEQISVAYQAVSGKDNVPPGALQRLLDLGLVIPGQSYPYGSPTYYVPRLVAARIPAHPLLPVIPAPNQPPARHGPQLSMAEVFQVVVRELEDGTIGKKTQTIERGQISGVPEGWYRTGDQSPQVVYGKDFPLAPVPSPLSHHDFNRLADRTGQSAAMLDFALSLLLALGIVRWGKAGVLYAREDRLQELMAMPPGERLIRMVSAWLAMNDAADFRQPAGPQGRLQLHYRPSYYGTWGTLSPPGAAVRRLVAHLVGHLPAGEWHDFASLFNRFEQLKALLPQEQDQSQQSWWFVERQSGRRLNLGATADWRHLWHPIIAGTLTGPLTWLGLVDTLGAGDKLSFWVRPDAAALVGGNGVQVAEAPPLVLDMDRDVPSVVVPGGTPDGSVHMLLAAMGELAEASRQGLRYRLTRERVQMVFDEGMSGPELIDWLAERAGGKVPARLRETLESWWAGYGTVRLYDELTLIELSDDILLRELQATSSLDRMLIHAFSPRLIAVDPTQAQDLIAELTRLGHMPRVVEA